MKQNEQELEQLKNEINQMWQLVISQLEKSKEAFLHNNTELALEITSAEKRVNAFELKVESSCENYIALFNPVAIDLRLVLSIMKISITLERIGDYADSIARHIIEDSCNRFNEDIINQLELEKMLDILISMMTDSYVILNSENSQSFGRILAKDKGINEIYRSSIYRIEEILKQESSTIHCGLKLMLVLRNMERIGDHCKNIVEEIVFYTDAKVLKHKGKIE
ncbi:MAG: phosphate signaling complex protein PhoU [Bacteroidia bacterium]|nr:phosphate signaling complex protein PhoU [Bacteroidia bacterium]